MSGLGRAQRRAAQRHVIRPGQFIVHQAGTMVCLQSGPAWWSMTPSHAMALAAELRHAARAATDEAETGEAEPDG